MNRGEADKFIKVFSDFRFREDVLVKGRLVDGYQNGVFYGTSGCISWTLRNQCCLTEMIPARPNAQIDLLLLFIDSQNPNLTAVDNKETVARITLVKDLLTGFHVFQFSGSGQLRQLIITENRKKPDISQKC